jgi:hypothetical protein
MEKEKYDTGRLIISTGDQDIQVDVSIPVEINDQVTAKDFISLLKKLLSSAFDSCGNSRIETDVNDIEEENEEILNRIFQDFYSNKSIYRH